MPVTGCTFCENLATPNATVKNSFQFEADTLVNQRYTDKAIMKTYAFSLKYGNVFYN